MKRGWSDRRRTKDTLSKHEAPANRDAALQGAVGGGRDGMLTDVHLNVLTKERTLFV